MNRRIAIMLLKPSLMTGLGLAFIAAWVDCLKGWFATGYPLWGSGSLLLILLFGWTLVFLPGSLLGWLLALGLAQFPKAGSWLENKPGAIVSGLTSGLAFFMLAGLMAFRVWLPDGIRIMSVMGMGVVILLGILAVLAGSLLGWCVHWMNAKYPRRSRLVCWGFVAGVLLLAIVFSLQNGNGSLELSPARNASGNNARPNVIILLLDALRADALGCYGKSGAQTPAIDQFAADSVLYQNAFTTAPWTRPAMASIWTGLYPSSHQVRRGNKMAKGADRLTEKAITLAEHLGSAGYKTYGLNTNPVIMPQFGLAQGFDLYYTFPYPITGHSTLVKVIGAALSCYFTPKHYKNGGSLTSALIKLLQKPVDEPFLLYTHYMDPHEPYWEKPGKTWSRMFDRDVKDLVDVSIQRYQGEVRYLDEHIGRLMQALKDKNLYDDSLIILLADHGEEFFEHGETGHGDNLTQEVMHIPLLIKFPGRAHAGTRVEDLVSLVDVAPTVMQVSGLQVPGSMQGMALTPRARPDRILYTEVGDDENRLRSIITPEWKLIERFGRDRRRSTLPDIALFNRISDPQDQEEISAQHPEVAASLQALMEDHFRKALAESLPREAAEMNREVQDRMNTLGYLR